MSFLLAGKIVCVWGGGVLFVYSDRRPAFGSCRQRGIIFLYSDRRPAFGSCRQRRKNVLILCTLTVITMMFMTLFIMLM